MLSNQNMHKASHSCTRQCSRNQFSSSTRQSIKICTNSQTKANQFTYILLKFNKSRATDLSNMTSFRIKCKINKLTIINPSKGFFMKTQMISTQQFNLKKAFKLIKRQNNRLIKVNICENKKKENRSSTKRYQTSVNWKLSTSQTLILSLWIRQITRNQASILISLVQSFY